MNGKLTQAQRLALGKLGRNPDSVADFSGDVLLELLDKWAQVTQGEIRKSLTEKPMPRAAGGNAISSRSLFQSISPVPAVSLGREALVKIQVNDYYQYIDGGRGPTKQSQGGALVKALAGPGGWIAQKGIQVRQSAGESRQTVAERNLSLAYAIAKKIHSRGFQGNRFWSDVVNQKMYDDLGEYLGESLGETIRIIFDPKNNKA